MTRPAPDGARALATLASIGRRIAGTEPGPHGLAEMIPAAARSLLLPALGAGLTDADRAADREAAATAEAARLLNADRNRALLGTLAEIGGALAAAGIRAVALKGAAHLLTGLWPEGARVSVDLDLLLAGDQIGPARAALARLGARPTAAEDPVWAGIHRHGAPLKAPHWLASVELHAAVVMAPYRHLAPAEAVAGRAFATAHGGGGIAIPSPADRALVALVHGPLGGPSYPSPWLEMRDLLDLVFLARRHGPDAPDPIDWEALADPFARAGWGVVPALATRLATEFCGAAPPLPRQGALARLDAARWRAQLASPTARAAGRGLWRAGMGVWAWRQGGERRALAIRAARERLGGRRAAPGGPP